MPKKADLCDDRIQRKQKLQKINFMLDNPNRQETRLPSKWQEAGSRSLHFEFARAFYKRNLGARKISKYHNMKPQR